MTRAEIAPQRHRSASCSRRAAVTPEGRHFTGVVRPWPFAGWAETPGSAHLPQRRDGVWVLGFAAVRAHILGRRFRGPSSRLKKKSGQHRLWRATHELRGTDGAPAIHRKLRADAACLASWPIPACERKRASTDRAPDKTRDCGGSPQRSGPSHQFVALPGRPRGKDEACSTPERGARCRPGVGRSSRPVCGPLCESSGRRGTKSG